MAIGGILEEKTTAKAKQGLKKLINLTPTQGRKIENENEILIPAEYRTTYAYFKKYIEKNNRKRSL